jgi:hypothetical protein
MIRIGDERVRKHLGRIVPLIEIWLDRSWKLSDRKPSFFATAQESVFDGCRTGHRPVKAE